MVQIRNMLLPAIFAAFLVAGMGVLVPAGGFLQKAQAQSLKRGPSGLPLPRFVSLKSAKGNVRRGPGQNYEIAWAFGRAGLPVEIVQEFDNWRKIRDAEGDEGWVFHSLLSGERSVIVAPWAGTKTFALRTSASDDTTIIAYLEASVISQVVQCDGQWCQVRGQGYDGWISQDNLWGVYPSEQVESR
jgi:SH3-like domain-containing protein